MRSGFLAFSLVAGLLLLPPLVAPEVAAQPSNGSPGAAEWLAGVVDLRAANLTAAAASGDFSIHKTTFSGSSRSASDLRDIYANAQRVGSGDQLVATLERDLSLRLQLLLATTFNSGAASVLEARVDRATHAPSNGPDAFHPPIRFTFNATVPLPTAGLNAGGRALDEARLRTLMTLGVDAALSYNLSAQPGWNVTYTFRPPAWIKVAAAEGATRSPDGATATWDLRNWRGVTDVRSPVMLTLQAREAPPEPATDAHVDLTLDMADVTGLSLGGLATGNFGKLAVKFDAALTIHALRLTDFPELDQQVRSQLPASLQLGGLTADGLRIAAREGVLPADALAKLDAYFRALALERISALGPDAVDLEGGFAPDTLSAQFISDPPDGNPPLTYHATAGFRIPLGKSEASRVQAASGSPLIKRTLAFDLPRVRGLDTTYRITLPPGIALTDVQPEGARAERGVQGDRDVVVITPDSNDARATFVVAVTSDFILAQFWYLWLGLLILIVVVVAFFLTRQRRRKATPAPAAQREAAPESEALPVATPSVGRTGHDAEGPS